ncbi:MAG: AAA domain-containing protein [Chitinophagaceae bacterium]
MDYFGSLQSLLQIEKDEDRRLTKQVTETLSAAERRDAGLTWYPVTIKDTETGRADYLTIEVERTSHHDQAHQLRFGISAVLFSKHDARLHRLEGIISYINGNRLKIALRTDELPDWAGDGKLGIDAIFDENSYKEMEAALTQAQQLSTRVEEGRLVNILIGAHKPTFHAQEPAASETTADGRGSMVSRLNPSQRDAVTKIMEANELAIVHGPPGTGKTSTLVEAIRALHHRDHEKILVVAPSNAAVDLLTEKLTEAGLNVVRVGNPARVSERLAALTLDSRINAHPGFREIKRLKKQAGDYRDMAQKYKRNFGKEEREQRKALFTEARNIAKEVERTESYIVSDVLNKADAITATLVGANHYTVRQLKYGTVVMDEAGQALEPAAWIPILKASRLVMAGDHFQLPPTIKSALAARAGLGTTLLEKCATLHPQAVVRLEEQYRMHEMIAGFSSQQFYEGQVKANSAVAGHLLFPGDTPLVFIDTAGCGFEEAQQGTGTSNSEEADFLLKQLVHLVSQLKAFYPPGDFPRIAIISPYSHQVEALKQAVLNTQALDDVRSALSVNTIDSFQGQEREAVYISMTRSNAEGIVGFLSDTRRMNVAMTRARKKLVVIGDSATLSAHPFYAAFIAYAEMHKAYVSAWELMEW